MKWLHTDRHQVKDETIVFAQITWLLYDDQQIPHWIENVEVFHVEKRRSG